MDWSRLGRAFVQMELDSLKLVRGTWPNFDRRYYEEAEQVYLRWLSEMREAGLASPTGLLVCLIWLYGLAWARLPAPWRWAAVLITVLWAAGALRTGARTPDRGA
jgi:hypothetical protein